VRRRDAGQVIPLFRAIVKIIRRSISAGKEGEWHRGVIFRRHENRGADVRTVRRLRCKPEHPMTVFLPQRLEESLAPGVRPLDHDNTVLAEPPFLFATGGIEVAVVCSELPEDLRLAVPVIAEFRAFDLQEIAEGLAGVCRIGDIEDRVRVDRMLEVRLLPRVSEPVARAQPVERDMKRCNLQFMVQGSKRMLIERFRRRSGITVSSGVSDALRGKPVEVRDAAPIMPVIKVRRPIKRWQSPRPVLG
jgi:hypothetical protein